MTDPKDKIEIIPLDLDVDLNDVLKTRRGIVDPELRKKASEVISQVKERQKAKKIQKDEELYGKFEILFEDMKGLMDFGGAIQTDVILEVTGLKNMISFVGKFKSFLKLVKDNQYIAKKCQRDGKTCYRLELK
jgi:hypothetical protein